MGRQVGRRLQVHNMFTFKITRLERIKEDGVFKQAVVGVNCINSDNNQSSYIDWIADKADISPLTKDGLKIYIKNYLTKKEKYTEMQKDGTTVEKENPSIAENLKAQTLRPIITRMEETLLTEEDKVLTV